MMRHVTPESVGIQSRKIKEYIELLEKKRLATHNVIMAKGNDIFFEKYWHPFHRDFLHRMYSVSKSFVSLAIGFLCQDGKIDLDDPMEAYFAKELEQQPDENMHRQTVRHMLMMSTAKPTRSWFAYKPQDRVAHYFANDSIETRPPGTIFCYDSEGSFVLGALVERITGKSLMDYLYEKLFSKIGVSEDTCCLKCPGGHSWGDSGILCRPIDLLKVARFVLNGGIWEGEQILDGKYLEEATDRKIFNNYKDVDDFNTQGYGWQFWKTYEGNFFFNGMGCQFAVCIPNKDLILIYNGDNQGKESVRDAIIEPFFRLIADTIEDEPLEENVFAYEDLEKSAQNLKLVAAQGARESSFEEKINGVWYQLSENPMGISRIRFLFEKDGGKMEYVNQQGEKSLSFGRCENVYGKFPQEGYSDEVGAETTKGFYYQCAASAAWVEEQKLYIKVQIIDRYLGNMSVTVGFAEDECGIYMEKYAEGFLEEYQGFAGGKG